MRLRVVIWNVQGKAPGRVGMDRLIADWRPDLLLLQEADVAAVEAHPSLAAALPHRFMHSPAGYRSVIAILSAHPVRATGMLDAPREIFDRPRLLWADLALPDGRGLVVASVHTTAPDRLLPPFYDARKRNRELGAIAEFARSLLESRAELVLGGDFNTIRYEIPGMTDAALVTDSAAPTWRGLAMPWMPAMLRLDRIFVGPALEVRGSQVWRGRHGSDHHPVRADLSFT